jgi:tRNA-modifying protein YgfZ
MSDPDPGHDVSSQSRTLEREYWEAVRNTAMFDLSQRGHIELIGPDAAGFLHNLCTNDILHLAPGAGCEAFFVTLKAKIVAHAYIWHTNDSLWLDVAASARERLLGHLNRHLISERAELADRSTEFAHLYLAGPKASSIVKQAAGSAVAELLELQEQPVGIASAPGCRVRRHGLPGLPGYAILCPSADVSALRQLLIDCGACPAGPETYDTLRIEAGVPAEGVDFDENTLVMEMGRTREAISYTKGCYLGQEPIVRARDLGHVNRNLLGLKIDSKEPVKAPARITRVGNDVGQLTSSAYSPRLLSAIGLGFIRRGNQEPGTLVQLEKEGNSISAEVAKLPLVVTPS